MTLKPLRPGRRCPVIGAGNLGRRGLCSIGHRLGRYFIRLNMTPRYLRPRALMARTSLAEAADTVILQQVKT